MDPDHDVDEETGVNSAALARGQAYFDAVLAKSEQGADPFALEAPAKARAAVTAVDVLIDGVPAADDHRAFGAWFEANKQLILAGLYVVSAGSSWALMKGALITMHTPAVLAFLHLLAALLLQVALCSNGVIAPPNITTAAAKGALVPATLGGLQVLLVSAVLYYSSIYMLLCWVTVVPLLLGLTRAADISSKSMLRPVPQPLQVPLAVACAGLVLEMASDSHKGLVPLVLLLLLGCVTVLQLLWKQVKLDATLGHRIMDPDFLFRARQLSDLEDSLSPSTAALLAAALPAGPVLVIGLVCLEGKDLVDHEPSVPTLSVLLLSCLAFAGAAALRTMMEHTLAAMPQLLGLLTAAAALLAIVLDFLERAHALGLLCLLGVTMAVAGSLAAHAARWRGVEKARQHST